MLRAGERDLGEVRGKGELGWNCGRGLRQRVTRSK